MNRPIVLIIFGSLLTFLSATQSAAQFDGLDFDDFNFSVQAPREHVSLTSEFSGTRLVLYAEILPGWYLYSATQPGGPLPSTFHFDEFPVCVSDNTANILEIRPTTPPRLNTSPHFDVELEEHEHTVTWVFTFQEELSAEQVISGKLNGQVCQKNGLCIPVSVPFSARFNAGLDVDTLLKQAEDVAERFVWSRTGIKEPEPERSAAPGFIIRETVHIPNFWKALLFAFFGGVILNVMPCVLPVIGLKILSFFEQAGKSRIRAFMLNVWYAAGIISVFLVLAFLSLGLSILFTFDLFGIIMACVVFAMALSLMGIWTINVPSTLFNSGDGTTSQQLTRQEGVLGAYCKGIITTFLAIPCGAPLLSPAVNWADMQIRAGNMPEVFFMYCIIGLGMASPYLLLGAFPEWLRFLPKPGPWMETFAKTMGFGLLLAVVWILYFVPVEKILPTIALLFALWFVCWLYGEQQLAGKPKTKTLIISPIVLGFVILFSYQLPGVNNPYTLESAMKTRIFGHQGAHWQPYSESAFQSALSSGKTIVIDFTADWCVNCKVLEAAVLRSDTITTLLDKKGIVSLQADCTRKGEAMELLLKLGPMQVPALAIFEPAKPNEPTVIRGFYTQQSLAELLRAGNI